MKLEVTKRLLQLVLERGLSLIVVKTRISIIEGFKKSPIRIARAGSLAVYAASHSEHAQDMTDVLMKMGLWHFTTFYILICQRRAEEKIRELYRTKKRGLKRLEQFIAEDIVCAIDLLDNVMEFSFDDKFEGTLIDTFKDLFDNEV